MRAADDDILGVRNTPGDESREFHKRVRDAYLALAAREAHRFIVIDGAAGVEAVADRIWQEVARRV